MIRLIQTVESYLMGTCGIKQVQGYAAGKLLKEVEIDPEGLLSPWAEFICDCMQWVGAANKILEKEFTICDFDRYQEPTRITCDVDDMAARLANDRMKDVARIYELRGTPMPLLYGDTKRFANWPRTETRHERVKALLKHFTPKDATKARLARDMGLSVSTIGRVFDYADQKPGAHEPSPDTFDKLAGYFKMPYSYVMTGQLPQPECKPLGDAMTDYLLTIRQEVYARNKAFVFTGRNVVKEAIGLYSKDNATEIELLRQVLMFAPRRDRPIKEEIQKAAHMYAKSKGRRWFG